MTIKNSIEFTARERFLVDYYLTPQPVNPLRRHLWDTAIVLVSLVCMFLFYSHEDAAFAFIGYVLVVGRMLYLVSEGGRTSNDLRSAITKYDAKVIELEAALSAKTAGPAAG